MKISLITLSLLWFVASVTMAQSQSTIEFINAFKSIDAPEKRPFGLNEKLNVDESAKASETGSLIFSFLMKYYDLNSRKEDPDLYVREMDQIIQQTQFASILNCRDKVINNKKFHYSVKFYEDEESNTLLSVDTQRLQKTVQSSISLRLNLNLSIPVNEILPLYIHELVHICRAPEKAKLDDELLLAESQLDSLEKSKAINSLSSFWRTLPPQVVKKIERFDTARARALRGHIISELEGNYVMQIAHQDLSSRESLIGSGILVGISYGKRSRWLEEGTFAQRMMYQYYQNAIYQEGKYIFTEENRAVKYYDDSYDQNQRFVFFPLNSELKQAIESLGIEVAE